jgi:hypothetical protein
MSRTRWDVVSKRTGQVWVTVDDPHYIDDWVTRDNFDMRRVPDPYARMVDQHRLLADIVAAYDGAVALPGWEPAADRLRRAVEAAREAVGVPIAEPADHA